MALHRPRRTSETGWILAGSAVMGAALAAVLVAGVTVMGDARTGLLLVGEGLGAGMLTLSLTGLFACAIFGTGFTLPDDHPRHGSMRSIALRLRTRRRPPRS